jgi:putative membrane protein
MTNKHLIKSAHIVALMVLLAGGILVIAGKAGVRTQNQNSNENQNSKSRANENRSNRNAQGGKVGMGNLNAQDSNFLMDAAMGGMMEVELGRVATQKGASDAVKQFGQRMVDDHSAANTELTSLASGKGITLPTTLDEKHQAHVTKLSAMSGAEFDRAYGKMMVSDHTKDVAEFEKQSTKGTDPDLKAFAGKTLPTLQEHLKMAQALPGAGETKKP